MSPPPFKNSIESLFNTFEAVIIALGVGTSVKPLPSPSKDPLNDPLKSPPSILPVKPYDPVNCLVLIHVLPLLTNKSPNELVVVKSFTLCKSVKKLFKSGLTNKVPLDAALMTRPICIFRFGESGSNFVNPPNTVGDTHNISPSFQVSPTVVPVVSIPLTAPNCVT